MKINITGASQRVSETANGIWSACYVCHKCGDELATNWSNDCPTETRAREESDLQFDKQQRRFCARCGYRITDKKLIPENDYIARLNELIDEHEEKQRKHVSEILQLRKEVLGLKKHLKVLLKKEEL